MSTNEVMMYTRTQCSFCDRAKQLLDAIGVTYQEINLDDNKERVTEMIQKSEGRRSVPQIFINGQSVGGFDDLAALQQSGQLKTLLN